MLKTMTLFRTALVVLALTAQVQAGGFWLVAGNPEASPEAKNSQAVLTVKAVGCHEPDKALVTGTAVGVVNGQRQVVQLKLQRLSTPGMYAITRQWPAEGKWVLSFEGKNGDALTSLMVTAGPGGVDRAHAHHASGAPDKGKIEALLAKN